jgi:C_GCAxxG_C_C family probable redox protein
MWDVYDLGNEDFLWSCIAFMGGISGQQQAPCGAVSASAVCLGLRHRCSLSDKEKARQSRTMVRYKSAKLVKDFQEKFGNITCAGLLAIDFSKPSAYQEFRESGVWKDRCNKYIEFIIERLYEFEDEKSGGKTT